MMAVGQGDVASLALLAAYVLLLASAFAATAGRRHALALGAGLVALGVALAAGGSLLALTLAAVFALAHGLQLWRTGRKGRTGLLTAEERALIAEVLSIEEPAKQRRLRDVITWRDAETGEVLMRQGQAAPPLIYVATGQMEIEHEGLPVSTCGPDDFLGEMSLVTGAVASATVKVSLPARIAVFDRDGLKRLMEAMPELARAFDRRLNKGLADKIMRMNKARAER